MIDKEIIITFLVTITTISSAFFAAVTKGYIQIGKPKNGSENGNGKSGDHKLFEFRLDEYQGDIKEMKSDLKQLVQTANHNTTKISQDLDTHTRADGIEFKKAEVFRVELRYFMLAVAQKLGIKIPNQNE